MSDIDDFLGPEHYPTCPCFTDGHGNPERMRHMREAMAIIGDGFAQSFVASMAMNNICPAAMPHFLAMMVHMTIGLGAQAQGVEDGPEYIRKMREDYERLNAQGELLMSRAMRTVLAGATGGERVQ